MPGVTSGQNWDDRDSQLSDFKPYSGRAMSPHRQHNVKGGSSSQYSNGYSSDQHSDSNDDGPGYLLEHLATFSVGPQYGLLNPKDGLRRLHQMEKSSGIWTQKMQMRLEKKWVIIIDYENGDVVERFPMNLISEPTSYTSDDPRELYNNILIFIVKEDPKSKSHNPSEMHIFQCARVSAQEVVDEMKMYMSGKWKSGYRDVNVRHLPPPSSNPPQEVNLNGVPAVNVREQVNLFNAAAAAAASNIHHGGHRLSHHLRGGSYSRESNDETSSTSSEKYERDVAILNHCFDDIERFIARLQHAAAAFKELERRQKSRKNKKKDIGDGMLSMRAKPPPEREFIDVLQKFKLSFNLLAKLKSHIHDPNAPELVHFLFTPLALIVDAARDSNYSTSLPARVVAPLLTRDAMELLTNCCTSKECDLWHSLGDPWIIPKEQWKGYEGNYHPVFSDGWAPEYPFSEDRERVELTAAAAASAAQRFRREEIRRAQDEVRVTPAAELRQQDYRGSSRQEKDSRYGSDYYYSTDRTDRDRPGSPGIPSDTPQSHQSFDNQQYDSHHINMSRRELFDRSGGRSPSSDRDFRDHRDRDGRSDFSADSIEPGSAIDPHRQFERQQRQWFEDLKMRGAKIVQVMYPRTANNDKELTVLRGEFLEVLDDSRKWWKARNIRGQVAHVPHTIVAPHPGNGVEDDIFSNPLYGSRDRNRDYYSPSESPVGRDRLDDSSPRESLPHRSTPAAIPTPAPADWVRRERQGKKDKVFNQASISNSEDGKSNQKSIRDSENARYSELIPHNSLQETLPTSVPISRIGSQSSSKSRKTTAALASQESPETLLQEELKLRVTLGPKAVKQWGLAQKHQVAYIVPESSKEDVQLWLEFKGFSQRVQQVLSELNGQALFHISKEKLEKFLGIEEATRLFSNITVQKNLCSFKTYRTQELKSILDLRRKKVDSESADDAEEAEA